MIIPAVIIPTYITFFIYLIGVSIYLKRFILRPPADPVTEAKVAKDDPSERQDESRYESELDLSSSTSGALSRASIPLWLYWFMSHPFAFRTPAIV